MQQHQHQHSLADMHKELQAAQRSGEYADMAVMIHEAIVHQPADVPEVEAGQVTDPADLPAPISNSEALQEDPEDQVGFLNNVRQTWIS